MDHDNDKAKSKSVTLPPSLWEKVEGKALDSFGGNRSNYIRNLIEQDLGMVDRKSSEFLELQSIASKVGIDAESLVRAAISAVVRHAHENLGEISLPLRIAARDDLADDAYAWATLDNDIKEVFLEHADKNDPWHSIVREDPGESYKELAKMKKAFRFISQQMPRTDGLLTDSQAGYGVQNGAEAIAKERYAKEIQRDSTAKPKHRH